VNAVLESVDNAIAVISEQASRSAVRLPLKSELSQ
jgi:hypothetical protein